MPKRERILNRPSTLGGVENKLDLARQHRVNRMRPTFHDFVDPCCWNTSRIQGIGGAACRQNLKAIFDKIATNFDKGLFVFILDRNKDSTR